MGALQTAEAIFIKVPEWCLEIYALMPTADEITAAAKHLLENPEVAKAETAIDNATLALIARDKEGLRHFTDDVVGFLATRQHEVIQRILTECGTLYDDVKAAITEKLKGNSDVVTDKNANIAG